MFFEEVNCRAVSLLDEASKLLNASLTKLLEFEREIIVNSNEILNNSEIETKPVIKNGVIDGTEKAVDNPVSNAVIKCVQIERLSNPTVSNSISNSNDYKNCLDTGLKPTLGDVELPRIISISCKTNKNKKSNTISLANFKEECPQIDYRSSNTFPTSNGNKVQEDCSFEEEVEMFRKLKPVKIAVERIKLYKVNIKFIHSMEYKIVEELLKSVGLGDFEDLLILKKNAEVTFLNEVSQKKALNLPPSSVKKLKACSIEEIPEESYALNKLK